MVLCPICITTILNEIVTKVRCRCPYKDYRCENGHISHCIPGSGIFKPGYTHPAPKTTFPLQIIFFGFICIFLLFLKRWVEIRL
jgi:hypothetical protein